MFTQVNELTIFSVYQFEPLKINHESVSNISKISS